MKKLILAFVVLSSFTISCFSTSKSSVRAVAERPEVVYKEPVKLASIETKSLSATETLYNKINFQNVNQLRYDVFEKALRGFENLKKSGKIDVSCKLLTVCDFSLSSNTKRLWVINTESGQILFNSLVAHGKNTGEEFAEHFSNIENSLQSSLGFYITDTTYDGDNGYSLKLLGMDHGFNDNALQRLIVMHGADYVSEEFATENQRIGRSWGCPAVPRDLAMPIIDTIKGKNVLFIFYPDENYLNSSEWLKS